MHRCVCVRLGWASIAMCLTFGIFRLTGWHFTKSRERVTYAGSLHSQTCYDWTNLPHIAMLYILCTVISCEQLFDICLYYVNIIIVDGQYSSSVGLKNKHFHLSVQWFIMVGAILLYWIVIMWSSLNLKALTLHYSQECCFHLAISL